MHVFDRVFDREDVAGRVFVAMVDHCRQRGALAGAGGADHQHHAAFEHHQILDDFGHVELLESRHLGLHVAQHHRHGGTLMEDVDAKAAQSAGFRRHVDLQPRAQHLQLLRRENAIGKFLDEVAAELGLAHGQHLALDLEHRRRIRREEQIGGAFLDGQLEVGQQLLKRLQGIRRGAHRCYRRNSWPSSSSFICMARTPGSSSRLCRARVDSSLTRRRSSFWLSALRRASS